MIVDIQTFVCPMIKVAQLVFFPPKVQKSLRGLCVLKKIHKCPEVKCCHFLGPKVTKFADQSVLQNSKS